MQRDKIRYLEVSKVLKREVKQAIEASEKAGEERKVNQAVIAKRSGYSAGAFSAYITGDKGPDEAFVRKFTHTLYASDKRRAALAEEIWAAAQKPEAIFDSVVDRLQAGGRLTCTTTDYPPFAGADAECFFHSVFSRFFDIAGITVESPDPKSSFPSGDEHADVSLGLYESADRMLRWGLKFWRFPIRMGLGAVCLKRFQPHLSSIASVLSGVKLPRTARPIRPIVVKNGVGALHCLKRLKYEEHQLAEVERLDVPALKKRLLLESETAGLAIPVVCVDEYTALRLLGALGDAACSVFAQNSRFAAQDRHDRARRELPQYFCSVAIDRRDHRFQEFMHDALVQFLSTEIETTANSWAHLAQDLADRLQAIQAAQGGSSGGENSRLADAQRWASAWEWVFYTLTLYADSTDSFVSYSQLPWKPILQRARQLVHLGIARHELLPDVVTAYGGDRDEQGGRDDGQEKNSYGLDHLCRILDVELPPHVKTLDSEAFTHALREKLQGTALHPYVGDSDPTEGSTLARVKALAMRGFMRNMENLYDATGHPDAVTRLREDIDQLETPDTQYGRGRGLILLARIPEETDKFVGGLCLRGLDSTQAELRYLWIEPHYRGRSIGKALVERAVSIARDPGVSKSLSRAGVTGPAVCKEVYVEVLQEEEVLQTAAKLFTDNGFIKSATNAQGRDVFILTL